MGSPDTRSPADCRGDLSPTDEEEMVVTMRMEEGERMRQLGVDDAATSPKLVDGPS